MIRTERLVPFDREEAGDVRYRLDVAASSEPSSVRVADEDCQS